MSFRRSRRSARDPSPELSQLVIPSEARRCMTDDPLSTTIRPIEPDGLAPMGRPTG